MTSTQEVIFKLLKGTYREIVNDMIHDVMNEPVIGSDHLTLWQNIPNIWNRFKRQYKYRTIETECVDISIWNMIVFSSFLHRRV